MNIANVTLKVSLGWFNALRPPPSFPRNSLTGSEAAARFGHWGYGSAMRVSAGSGRSDLTLCYVSDFLASEMNVYKFVFQPEVRNLHSIREINVFISLYSCTNLGAHF